MFKRIAIGISGGVDSAVAAALLKDKGFLIQGVFMKNWDLIDETGTCSAEKDFQDAKSVCDVLRIPLIKVDFVKQYWNEVFTKLIDDYQAGLTPNPDVLCNRYVKFDAFYNYCRNQLQCDAIATGHYANTTFGPFLENYDPRKCIKLLRPVDKYKDQTFFLSQVKQEPLRHTMFPIATLKKSTVRIIAKERGLMSVVNKRDSTGICFVGKRPFQQFISEYIETKPGKLIDIETGKVVGTHNGFHHWTIGQRCNLSGFHIAYFILKKDLLNNNIYVAPGTDHPSLWSDIVITNTPHWIYKEPEELERGKVFECYFRFQHATPLVKCRVMKTGSSLTIKLEKSLRALTEGQYAVLFDDNECFGSARIVNVGPSAFFTEKKISVLN